MDLKLFEICGNIINKINLLPSYEKEDEAEMEVAWCFAAHIGAYLYLVYLGHG